MKTNKERFLDLVSPDTSNTLQWAEEQESKRGTQRLSQNIAIKILKRLSQLNWTQRDLADNMEIKAQQVNKWLKGKENFTIETILKISEVLKIELIEIPKLSTEVEVSENTAFIETAYKLTPTKVSKTLAFENIVEEDETPYQVNYTK